MQKLPEKMLAVVTDTVSWHRFSLLAKAIEEQAKAYDHFTVFFNAREEYAYGSVEALLDQLKPDGCLISRRMVARRGLDKIYKTTKRVALLDDHFLHLITKEGIRIPPLVLNKALTAVKHICI